MPAAVLPDFGQPVSLTNLPIPEPGPGEVRVRGRASSVNGFDLAVAAGYIRDWMEHRFPVVLGRDFAGTVDALGRAPPGSRSATRCSGWFSSQCSATVPLASTPW